MQVSIKKLTKFITYTMESFLKIFGAKASFYFNLPLQQPAIWLCQSTVQPVTITPETCKGYTLHFLLIHIQAVSSNHSSMKSTYTVCP